MKKKQTFNTAANAEYHFDKSDDLALNDLHEKILALSKKYVSKEKIISLIRSVSAATQTKFYSDFKLGTQNFMIERGVLKAGSDADLAMLVANQPPNFFTYKSSSSNTSTEFMMAVVNRGLVKTLDTIFSSTPASHHEHLLHGFFILLLPNPDREEEPRPTNEAGQNYLRALDYLLAKISDANKRNAELQGVLIKCALYPALLVELDKRGAPFAETTQRMGRSVLDESYGPQQQISALEDYQRAKYLGCQYKGENWLRVYQDNDTLAKIVADYEAVRKKGGNDSEIISSIQAKPIDITTFCYLAHKNILDGRSEVVDFLINNCTYLKKEELASYCLPKIGESFALSVTKDVQHDEKVLACLDILIKRDAAIGDENGMKMIVSAALHNRLDIIPALISRGAPLKWAKDHASCYVEDPYNDEGYGPSDEDLANYQLLANYTSPPSAERGSIPIPASPS